MGTARTAGIAEAEGDVVFFTDVEETVIIFVERIFLVVHFHPGEEQRAATGNDVSQARVVFDALCRLAVHAAVDGHEVDAIFCVLFDDGEEFIDGNVFQVFFQHADRIVHGDRADHGRRHLDQFAAEVTGLAEIGQVHDSFCFHVDGILDFLQFFFVVVVFRRNAEVDIDFRAAVLADSFRRQAGMDFVGRNGDFPAGDEGHEFFNGHVFLFSDNLHLRRDDAFAGSVHLCCVIHYKHPSYIKIILNAIKKARLAVLRR